MTLQFYLTYNGSPLSLCWTVLWIGRYNDNRQFYLTYHGSPLSLCWATEKPNMQSSHVSLGPSWMRVEPTSRLKPSPNGARRSRRATRAAPWSPIATYVHVARGRLLPDWGVSPRTRGKGGGGCPQLANGPGRCCREGIWKKKRKLAIALSGRAKRSKLFYHLQHAILLVSLERCESMSKTSLPVISLFTLCCEQIYPAYVGTSVQLCIDEHAYFLWDTFVVRKDKVCLFWWQNSAKAHRVLCLLSATGSTPFCLHKTHICSGVLGL